MNEWLNIAFYETLLLASLTHGNTTNYKYIVTIIPSLQLHLCKVSTLMFWISSKTLLLVKRDQVLWSLAPICDIKGAKVFLLPNLPLSYLSEKSLIS